MTLKYICDKCNKLTLDKDITSLTFRNPTRSKTRFGYDNGFDLCKKCYKDFQKWIKDKK